MTSVTSLFSCSILSLLTRGKLCLTNYNSKKIRIKMDVGNFFKRPCQAL
ncbi:hypothetical protein GYH30_029566 [Glycine max]|nr:hypothetical protein GYH30_029566 [Glycine max]